MQAGLDNQRDTHFLSFSQDNRALKEELVKLKGVQERLDAANAEVAKQKKVVARLPKAEAERDAARKEASDAASRESELKTRLE